MANSYDESIAKLEALLQEGRPLNKLQEGLLDIAREADVQAAGHVTALPDGKI